MYMYKCTAYLMLNSSYYSVSIDTDSQNVKSQFASEVGN